MMPAHFAMLMLLLLCCTINIRCSKAPENATDMVSLLGFEEAITSDPLGVLSTWNTSIHICRWEGVKCSRTHPGRVTALDLAGQGLTGRIASSLGNLTFLRELNLSSNSLSGQSPRLGRLGRLRVLDLSENYLQGTISGAAPTNCSGLRELDLSRNFLIGEIPLEVSLLSNLWLLRLSFNNLTRTIPPTIGNITCIKYIALSYNQLTGSIPDELGKLSNLSRLILGGNNLSGDIWPQSLLNTTSLQFLGLEKNRLGKVLPLNIGDTLPNLVYLSLYENLFGGPIPVSLGNASVLQRIDLSSNSFSGQVPRSIGYLSELFHLNLEGNNIQTSDIQSWEFIYALANCSLLQWVSLDQNQLHGAMPHATRNMSLALQELYLDGSKLSGLVKLGLSDNNLTGTVEWIVNMENLQGVNLHVGSIRCSMATGNSTDMLSVLDFKKHIIEDPKGAWAGVTCSRKHPGRVIGLDLTDRSLTGTISSSLGNLTLLKELNLSLNSFSGELPRLNHLNTLRVLDLMRNSLHGIIPDWVTNCSGLRKLDLSRNSFVGKIPIKLGLLSNLSVLRLYKNSLTGTIPPVLGTITGLKDLSLDYNHLEGSIPGELGKLSGLIALLGHIPASLGNASALELIDLSSNNFSGLVPSLFGKLSSLSELDLQGNNFEANDNNSWEFLHALGNCTELAMLFLGNNQLEGVIPSSIGNLSTTLQALGLATNQLTGLVPPSIGNLRALIAYHLSLENFGSSGSWTLVTIICKASYLK
uniref:non-specific serine/threonine protein kinase n=1 Tax=Leersia perrieri TaxID=77586 RepID=A0A0D9VI59_9ORYZ